MVAVYDVGDSGLRQVQCWRAHELARGIDTEVWITACDVWHREVLCSGGDDALLKGWDLRCCHETMTVSGNRTLLPPLLFASQPAPAALPHHVTHT